MRAGRIPHGHLAEARGDGGVLTRSRRGRERGGEGRMAGFPADVPPGEDGEHCAQAFRRHRRADLPKRRAGGRLSP